MNFAPINSQPLDQNGFFTPAWAQWFTQTVSPSLNNAQPSGLTPLMDGVATAGVVNAYARGDHRHPVDNSRLGALDTAVDSAKLGGNLPAYFLAASATAADSSKLGGTAAASYQKIGQLAVAGSTPANPTGTTSTVGVMMGLAGSITPVASSRVLVTLSGSIANNTINDGASLQLRYGTGTAPANAAALTGTQIGATQSMTALVAAQKDGFSVSWVITGLTPGTAYWVDASLAAVTGGTANLTNVTISTVEL